MERRETTRAVPGAVLRTAATAVLLAALTAVVALTVHGGGDLRHAGRLLWWYGAAWALFAAAAALVRRVPLRAATALVLAGSAALALAALSAAPRTSDDMYRYAWDGRVQAAGISPYAYPPDAPQLARLRDPWLFPADPACRHWDLHADAGLCTRINRPAVHTIYPPVAEGWFLAVHELSWPGSRRLPVQAAAALLAVATTAALVLVLRRRGDPRQAALWAWCPAVAFGAVNDAHIDTLGVLLAVLAFGARGARRRGALLGAAIAVKLLPVLALPGALGSVLRPGRPLRARARQTARVLLPALGVVALGYLPYVLLSGTGVIGYLPGYLQEEGYTADDSGRFAVLQVLLPGAWAGPAAVVVILAVAGYVLLRGDRRRPWSGALLVYGTALLCASSGYYWYALLVVALVALDGRWEWLAVPAAATVVYMGYALHWHGLGTSGWPYGIAALAVAAGTAMRALRSRAAAGRALPPAAGPDAAAAASPSASPDAAGDAAAGEDGPGKDGRPVPAGPADQGEAPLPR